MKDRDTTALAALDVLLESKDLLVRIKALEIYAEMRKSIALDRLTSQLGTSPLKRFTSADI